MCSCNMSLCAGFICLLAMIHLIVIQWRGREMMHRVLFLTAEFNTQSMFVGRLPADTQCLTTALKMVAAVDLRSKPAGPPLHNYSKQV